MSGQRKHESGAKQRKWQALKHEKVSELLKKTPKLTNIWSAATNPPASLPAAAATSTSTDQPTAMTSQSAASALSSTISADTTDGDAVYKETCKYFGFLTQLEKLSLSEIREQSVRLQTKYNADLADDFPDELAQFVNFSRVALTDPTTPRNLLS